MPGQGLFAALEKRVKAFVGAVLDVPPQGHADRLRRAIPEAPGRRHLPFDLYLTRGLESVPMFPEGSIDEYRFFVREGVTSKHDVEYVTRLDPTDEGTENYQAFGLFRLRGAWQPLPAPRIASVVERVLGPGPALDARALLVEPGPGLARVAGSATRVWRRIDGRRVTWADVLDVLRGELDTVDRIAWIEQAFTADVPEPVHRYYLDAQRRCYLVRAAEGEKRLYVAENSPEALLESATYLRRRAATSAPMAIA